MAASEIIEHPRFQWGDTVQVISSLMAKKIGSVCGIRKDVDCVKYLIEFADGESVELLEEELQAYED